MPRVSRELAHQHRRAITQASAGLFREHGLRGVSVAELTAAAGLTHGGFYGHFASKAALAGEACRLAFAQSAQRWARRVAAAPTAQAARAALIVAYLAASARKNPARSCPAAALAGDVAREAPDAPVRAAFADGMESLITILTEITESTPDGDRRQAALSDFCILAGALVLARATAGRPLSDALLAAARQRLLPPAAA
jgi:TetR/AcrR family transcriptional repressor of nem operon